MFSTPVDIYGCILFNFIIIINPIWTGLFANLKRLGGSILAPYPNLAISSQKIMKLGKGIL